MAPSPYSATIPNLQTAWDSTSLGALMVCPTYYKYTILDGWRPAQDKVDLEFGGYYASAVEVFKKAMLAGATRQAATIATLRHVLESTWIKNYQPGHCPCPDGCNGCNIPESQPWGGRYEEMWRCTGTTPYRNAKGNRAKCPYSHAGSWFPAPGPDICNCGSKVEQSRQWISNDKTKDRYTLFRLVALYCDEGFADNSQDGAYPYQFPNGKAAVELSFQFPLPWATPSGEPYILAGHLDSIMQYGQERFISDNKTTRKPLNAQYFAGYSPNLQVDVYDLAGHVLYPALGIKGVMIEGAQVLVDGARLATGINYRSDTQREELLEDLKYWIKQAEGYALNNYWPKNRKSCVMCPFKVICSKEPDKRQMYLDAVFVKHPWNPLEER